MQTKKITLEDVRDVACVVAQKVLDFGETVPDYSTRYPGKLESCLAEPFATFDGKFLRPGFEKKAAALFYLMIKNHPFVDGNKRIALVTLLIFCLENKRWIEVDAQEFYNFAVWIASSPPSFKYQALEAIEIFLKKHLVKK